MFWMLICKYPIIVLGYFPSSSVYTLSDSPLFPDFFNWFKLSLNSERYDLIPNVLTWCLICIVFENNEPANKKFNYCIALSPHKTISKINFTDRVQSLNWKIYRLWVHDIRYILINCDLYLQFYQICIFISNKISN